VLNKFNIKLLASRLTSITSWLWQNSDTRSLILGYFGASTGTAAALIAAATITGPIKNQNQRQAVERPAGKLALGAIVSRSVDERYRVGRLSAIGDLINGIMPDGWEAELCLNCNKPVNGAMVDAARTTRIMVSDRSRPLTHSHCRG
jgi:hypothetical protein